MFTFSYIWLCETVIKKDLSWDFSAEVYFRSHIFKKCYFNIAQHYLFQFFICSSKIWL